jgi:Uma2 family endonuclease
MSSTVKILPHYTYDDYCKWEGKWELIEGIPHAMSPAPVPKHQVIAGNIYAELKTALKKNKCDCQIYLPLDYKITEETIIQPDVLVACKPITKKYIDFAPALVVEVLSPATVLKDRNTKFFLYQHAGVSCYLIADPDSEKLEIYQLNSKNEYELQPYDPFSSFSFSFGENCNINVSLHEIWQ